jgi:hydroxyacylglutathione hydrolase
MIKITTIPILQDNYSYLLHDEKTGTTAIVDPSDADPLLKILEARGLKLDFILCTHHHADHTGGNLELKKVTNAKVAGASHDAHRIPGIDILLDESEPFLFGDATMKILKIPGHTLGHIALYFEQEAALFCGDTLFSVGCGKLFEGSPEQMWTSLNLLSVLPPTTKIYCGHEYTEANIQFAKTVDSKNKSLLDYEIRVKELRRQGSPTIPSIFEVELAVNPFLRCKNSDEFAKLRKLKDNFKLMT